MRIFLTSLFAILLSTNTANSAAAKACEFKAIHDKVDGKIYYDADHRLYKYVKLKSGDKRYCSEENLENAGYEPAPDTFSNSTARLVQCIEAEVAGCENYVIGQYRSLEIYDRACAGTESTEAILDGFLDAAKSDEKSLDVAKFYGTTSALISAFPCN